MADNKDKLPNPFFSDRETTMIVDALEMAAKSYKRAHNTRPEFASIARQLEADIITLAAKVKSQRNM